MEFWENLFKPHILERGKLYQAQGRVLELEFHHGIYSAAVLGTEAYAVGIRTIGEAIEGMTCTCTYAADGRNCKHMAAVLYAIAEQGGDEWEDDSAREDYDGDPSDCSPLLPSPEALICAMSEADIRDFLLKLAQEDPSIRDRLAFQCPKVSPEALQEHLRSQIHSITEYYEDSGELISENAFRYASDLADFIRKKSILLLNRSGFQAVLEISFEALEEYCSQDVDDPDGGISLLQWAIRSVCSTLLEGTVPEEQKPIFSWLKNYYDARDTHWIISSIIVTLMDTFFDAPSFTVQKLEIIETELQNATLYGYAWDLGTLLKKKYLLLRKLPQRQAEFWVFRKQYLDFSEVRNAEIQERIREQRYHDAVSLLVESKKSEQETPILMKQHTEQLISLYELLGCHKQLSRELQYYVLSFSQESLTYLLKLKTLVSENRWAAIRKKISE